MACAAPRRASKQQVITPDHQRGEATVPPVTDDERSIFPMSDDGTRAQSLRFSSRRYFFSTASGLIGARKLSRHKSISTQAVRRTWFGCTHMERSSATITVIVGYPNGDSAQSAPHREGISRAMCPRSTNKGASGSSTSSLSKWAWSFTLLLTRSRLGSLRE